jgi:hypothetical protein
VTQVRENSWGVIKQCMKDHGSIKDWSLDEIKGKYAKLQGDETAE